MKKCFDVVIIGAGLTGSLAAGHFTRLGKQVCIIERGGDYRPDSRQYWSSEHIQVADTNRWVTVARDDPYERVEMIGLNDPNCKYNMKFCVGGSMAVWTAIAFRFSPSDFKLRSRYGVGDDWPISYEVLAPWYEMAERELGVSGESGLSLWPRNSFYPMPAFRKSYLDRVFEKYFGVTFPMVPIPAGVASVKYRGRGPCIGAQSCEAFCPAEAKYDPAQTHLAAALKRANCTFIKRAFVKKILLADETDLVERVQVFPENMAPLEIQGKLFILAANTVENTRLLLYSATDRFPAGLANRNGLLGKYFMSTGAFVWNLEFPEMTYPGRGRPITSVCVKYR
jgi:glucose dehydrogenase